MIPIHLSLYRKWRPRTFSDVYGQDHIVTTLKGEIFSDRVHHAYIFVGSRGTGKTTCAKILAAAVNCSAPENGNPCLECDTCRGIESGSILDVVEIDAASNTGVDNIRDLKEEAFFTPAAAKMRVFIIDEVHMLSDSAFNALLKILEEPPAHVLFILATTEVHKVPATVLSRCQRFDFRRISGDEISRRLLFVAKKEKLSLTDSAAALLAKLSEGSLRDALSLLEQSAAFSEKVDESAVLAAAGLADRSFVLEAAEQLREKNAPALIALLSQLYSNGMDIKRFLEEILVCLRDIMLIKTAGKTLPDDLLECLPEETGRLRGIANGFSIEFVFRAMDEIKKTLDNSIRSLKIKTAAELLLIKLCSDISEAQHPKFSQSSKKVVSSASQSSEKPVLQDLPTPSEKIQTTESISAHDEHPPWEEEASDAFEKKAPESVEKRQISSQGNISKSEPFLESGSARQRVNSWPEIIAALAYEAPSLSGFMKDSEGFVEGEFLLVASDNEFFGRVIRQEGNAARLLSVVERFIGKKLRLKVSTIKEGSAAAKEEQDPFYALKKKAQEAGIPVNET